MLSILFSHICQYSGLSPCIHWENKKSPSSQLTAHILWPIAYPSIFVATAIHTALKHVTQFGIVPCKPYFSSIYKMMSMSMKKISISILKTTTQSLCIDGKISDHFTKEIRNIVVIHWDKYLDPSILETSDMLWNIQAFIEVWEWISNFIPHFATVAIIYPCWDYS